MKDPIVVIDLWAFHDNNLVQRGESLVLRVSKINAATVKEVPGGTSFIVYLNDGTTHSGYTKTERTILARSLG